ncbi:MAG: hypothetical protein ACRDD8_15045 [Bacteroidales bacterium]
MMLNARNNQFSFSFPANFFYPEVVEKWTPIVNKLKLPYSTLDDFMNANIQSVTFPSLDLNVVSQQESQFDIKWRGGKELEAIIPKNIDVTLKLSESYIPYWVIFEQISYFMSYNGKIPFWPNMTLSFLDNNGFENVSFVIKQVTPVALSELNLSHSSIVTEFKTFTLSLVYNRFEVKQYNDSGSYSSIPNY